MKKSPQDVVQQKRPLGSDQYARQTNWYQASLTDLYTNMKRYIKHSKIFYAQYLRILSHNIHFETISSNT